MPVPRGYPAFSVDEAVEAAQKLGGPVWVVKAQIHAGGRGKGGGVKVARSLDEVAQLAGEILGMQLVTHQTGPEGQKVRRLLIEEGADIKKESTSPWSSTARTQRVALMASSRRRHGHRGGRREARRRRSTRSSSIRSTGLTDAQADDVARKIGIPDASVRAGARRCCRGSTRRSTRPTRRSPRSIR